MNRPIIIVVIIVGLGSGLAFGQIQRNVLDASPQMGAGGYNRPTPVYQGGYGGGGFGNLYITGNVTGGKQFRGRIPYTDPTQFRGNLGSSYLSSFESEAPNLQRVESGMTGGVTMPFFNRSSTILPLSAIRENYNTPGSSLPRTQVLPQSPSYLTGATLERSYTQSMQEQLPAAIRSSDVLVPNVAIPEVTPEEAYLRPMDTTKRETPEIPLAERKRIEEQRISEEMMPEPMIETPEIQEINQAPADRDLSGWLKEQAEQAERASQSRLIAGPQQEYAESAKRLAVQGKEMRGAPGAATQPAKETLARAVRPSGQSGQVVVTTLAGRGSEAFDLTMRSGHKLMNQGRFYDAYQVYVQAASIKPDDPLAVYGQANALIAAGEFRSAGERLRRAMEMFPKFVHLTIDGARLLGSKTILERRLGQVRNLSIKNDDRDLVLLAGYLEILAGNHEAGLKLIGNIDEK
ncbi:MAG: tetratricopeptide repeat protein [Phycisphaerae bacterium]|nr:tetratricopeptide repeat protein [Phycisphaerae bacterium]